MRPPLRWLTVTAFALYAMACDDDSPGDDSPIADAAVGAAECAEGEIRPCPVGASQQACVAGLWGPCDAIGDAIPEVCDGIDDDGDGIADEGLVEPCGPSVGACLPGLRACVGGAWGRCVGAVGPGAERCDGVDDDCDGAVDEAPILSAVAAVQSPVVRGPDAMVWTGRAHAASLPGYPNWLMRFAPDGTVWRADLIGRVPVTLDLAAGPAGLALAWSERGGAPMFAVSGWGAPGLDASPVGPEDARADEVRIAGETRSTLVAWIDGADARPLAVVIDPATGEARFDAMPLGGPPGAVGLSVCNNGEDGFAAAWRVGAADEPGPVWFARLDNSGAAVVAFEAVPGGALSAAVLADYYIDAYAVAWSDGTRVHISRIDRGSGRVVAEQVVAEGQVAVSGLRFLRDDSTWGVFWSAEVEGEPDAEGPAPRIVRGRLLERSGMALTDVMDIMPSGERFAMTHGGPAGYAFATVRGDAFETRAGPIVCPAE